MEHALPGNPLVVYVVLPSVVIPILIGIAYWRLRDGERIGARAARWALIAAGLAFVLCTLTVMHGIVTSESSTASLAIIVIGPFGALLAALTFGVAWGISVVGQWVLAPSRRRPGDAWAVSLAWLIVVLTGGACTTIAYSAHLQGIARSEVPPSTLRDLSHRWWTDRDVAVRIELARNPRTPADVLAQLTWEPAVRSFVASNPRTPPEQLERMYIDPGSRMGLAENPSTPLGLLHELAASSDSSIHWALLRNPPLPDDILAGLADDTDAGHWAAGEIRRRADGRRWVLLSPPYTWRWQNPFRRVFDDAAPHDAWRGVQRFDTEDACQSLRTEFVRRETNRRVPLRSSWERPADFYSHTRCALARR